MKITEPKTPYAKHYDPAEDPSDDEQIGGEPGEGATGNSRGTKGHNEDEIPAMSLGEPEEAVPEVPADEVEIAHKKRKHSGSSSGSRVHVVDDEEQTGLTPEEREKHQRFEEMRKKHYEMKDVTQLLGHPEDLDELLDEDDGEDEQGNGSAVPPMPPLPAGLNGRSA